MGPGSPSRSREAPRGPRRPRGGTASPTETPNWVLRGPRRLTRGLWIGVASYPSIPRLAPGLRTQPWRWRARRTDSRHRRGHRLSGRHPPRRTMCRHSAVRRPPFWLPSRPAPRVVAVVLARRRRPVESSVPACPRPHRSRRARLAKPSGSKAGAPHLCEGRPRFQQLVPWGSPPQWAREAQAGPERPQEAPRGPKRPQEAPGGPGKPLQSTESPKDPSS